MKLLDLASTSVAFVDSCPRDPQDSLLVNFPVKVVEIKLFYDLRTCEKGAVHLSHTPEKEAKSSVTG